MGGISAAVCVVCMLGAAIFPFATYALPAMAGLALLPLLVEMGLQASLVCYTAVSILSLMLVPDIEAAMMFLGFFGYYPLIRHRLERIPSKFLRSFVKFSIFNIALLSIYWIVIHLLGLSAVAEELAGGFGWALLAVANFAFPLYDLAVKNITLVYLYRFRNRIFPDRH